MISEEQGRNAIQSVLSVQYTLGGTVYNGIVTKVSSRGFWFEGIGGRRGTETVEIWAFPKDLILQTDSP